MFSPFALPPDESAQTAAREIINKVHAYMCAHPNSELHKCGKMFGVLVVKDAPYLAAFSAKLDGSYYHEGFVPPVYAMPEEPIGTSKEESQRLQRLLFANYRFANGKGETKDLLEIFESEKTIFTPEEWFSDKLKIKNEELKMPPAGAGECCAPKLLQYALTHGLEPVALAEFWVGAAPSNELRREGVFYAPCSGKCVPILRHMLTGVDVQPAPQRIQTEQLCRQIEVVYEDDYLIVVNKPSGLLSVPGKEHQLSLAEWMMQQGHYAYLQPVHRLDQDTSGLLVLAKTPELYTSLQAYFQRRDIKKRYVALVQPIDAVAFAAMPDEGVIDLPLLPNPYDRPRQIVDKAHGKPSITRYIIRERRADGTALVDFFPLTGRTHQLRVHAAHPEGLGAPIIGDRLYGGLPADRLMLHAAEISFVHPIYLSSFCFDSSSSSSW